jgi:hypothetical protein
MEDIKAWVAFLDVYGFSAMVRDSPDGGATITDKLSSLVTRISRDFVAPRVSVHAFSDAIYITHPVASSDVKEVEVTLHACVDNLSRIISLYADYGLPLRGDIGFGRVIRNAGMLVGEAVLKAYSYEQLIGVPVVILPTVELSRSGIDLYNSPFGQLRQDLDLGPTGILSAIVVPPAPANSFLNLAEQKYSELVLTGPYQVARAWRLAITLLKSSAK